MYNNHNILLSKVITNATDTAWSQVYSTVNLYIALSIETTEENRKEPIALYGKEVLEKLQREFFAVDTKTLDLVKQTVETVAKSIEPHYTHSIVLATMSGKTLYIVVSSGGDVIIKRGEKIGTIAKGEANKVSAFSGTLQNDDIVILETEGFQKLIPVEKLSPMFDSLGVTELAEALAPLLHEKALGNEAAIILQYKSDETSQAVEPTEEEKVEKEEKNEEEEDVQEKETFTHETISPPAKSRFSRPSLPGINLKSILGRKKIIAVGIIILLIVLAGSIFFENQRQERKKQEKIFTEQIVPLQKKFEEAVGLSSLNKALALDAFTNIKSSLESKKNIFPKNSPEEKKLSELSSSVEKRISELENASSLQNQKIFFDPQNEEIKKIDLITRKGDALIAVNKDTGTTTILTADGKAKKTIKNEIKDITAVSADENLIYALSADGIITVDKKNGKKNMAIGDITVANIAGVDTFLGNIYVLNTKDTTVNKYSAGSTSRKSYFTNSVELSAPVSFSIDSSIWILEDSGKIRKFTKGKEDDFTVKGLTKPLGTGSLLYTDIDYANVYLLDTKNSRIVSIAKNGEIKNQYSSKDLSSVASFAVDEAAKKIYIVLNNKISSFDL